MVHVSKGGVEDELLHGSCLRLLEQESTTLSTVYMYVIGFSLDYQLVPKQCCELSSPTTCALAPEASAMRDDRSTSAKNPVV